LETTPNYAPTHSHRRGVFSAPGDYPELVMDLMTAILYTLGTLAVYTKKQDYSIPLMV
jgi:hypothetical protein